MKRALDAVLQAMWVCSLFEFYEPADDNCAEERDWRTAVHESGHALVALVEGTDFERVVLNESADGSDAPAGELVPSRDAWLPTPTFETRLAVDVAGAVAEELLLERVEPMGVRSDLRVALARAHITSVDDRQHVLESEGLGWVRDQVARVRRMLGRRRRALEALAATLLQTKDVTRHDAVRLVRQAGTRVRVRPTSSNRCPWEELRDGNLVRAELAERMAGRRRR